MPSESGFFHRPLDGPHTYNRCAKLSFRVPLNADPLKRFISTFPVSLVPPRRTVYSLIALFVPMAVFLIGLRYIGSGDTEPAELLPRSLLVERDLDFNEFVDAADLPYPYRRVNSRVVSAYPVMAGLLNLPVHAAAQLLQVDLEENRQLLCLISASLIVSLSCLLLFTTLLRLRHTAERALVFSLVYAFATCVWSIASRGLWQHSASLLWVNAALAALLAPRVAIAGLFLGLAVLSRPANALLAIPLTIFVWRHRRPSLPPFALMAALTVIISVVYSAAYLGNPLALGQAYRIGGGFGGDIAVGAAGLLVSPSRGLFVFTPIFLLSAAGIFLAWRDRQQPLYRYLVVASLLQVLLAARWHMWWGGSSFGYRLLLELVPALVIFLALAWTRIVAPRPALRACFGLLLIASIYVQYLGAMVYPSDFNRNIDLETSRLWDVRGSELVRLSKKLWNPTETTATEPPQLHVWWKPELNDDSIPGWLDASPAAHPVKGPLVISGWAKSSSGTVDVRIVLDTERVVVPERYARPDVANALPHLGDASQAGFRVAIQPSRGRTRQHSITVELRAPDGRVRLLGPVRFTWEE